MRIRKEDINEFRLTENGKRKYRWFKIGIILDILSTLSVSLLYIFVKYLSSIIF